MTKPTQAQIEAAASVIRKMYRQINEDTKIKYLDEMAEAALTAAAEVEPSHTELMVMGSEIERLRQQNEWLREDVKRLGAAVAKERERCARVVKELAEKYLVQFPAEYNAIMRAHAAIRGLKDE